MNVDEAFNLLEISKDATVEEIKTKYRDLAKKLHPDVNKAEDANDVFKKINEAHKIAQDFKAGKYQQNSMPNSAGIWDDIFSSMPFQGPFRRTNHAQNISPPVIKIKISFTDSVMGCQRPVIYNRLVICTPCSGQGVISESNGCTDCNGFGTTTINNGNMIFTSTCRKCSGKNVKRNKCTKCNSQGSLTSEVSASVNIPAGVKNGQDLRLRGAGHFVIGPFGGEGYGDAILSVEVESFHDMIIDGNDVVSTLNLTLLEALTGCKKTTITAYGDLEVEIPKLSSNKDEIKINNCGLKNTNGVHKLILNVKYPDNIDLLISALKEQSEN